MGIDLGIDECVNHFSAYCCIHTNIIVSYNPNKLAPAGGVHYPLFQFWNRHYESRVFLEDLQYTAGFHPEIFCLGGVEIKVE